MKLIFTQMNFLRNPGGCSDCAHLITHNTGLRNKNVCTRDRNEEYEVNHPGNTGCTEHKTKTWGYKKL